MICGRDSYNTTKCVIFNLVQEFSVYLTHTCSILCPCMEETYVRGLCHSMSSERKLCIWVRDLQTKQGLFRSVEDEISCQRYGVITVLRLAWGTGACASVGCSGRKLDNLWYSFLGVKSLMKRLEFLIRSSSTPSLSHSCDGNRVRCSVYCNQGRDLSFPVVWGADHNDLNCEGFVGRKLEKRPGFHETGAKWPLQLWQIIEAVCILPNLQECEVYDDECPGRGSYESSLCKLINEKAKIGYERRRTRLKA